MPPRRPSPFWPWLLLLLLLVLAGLGASWYLATRDETVEAEKVPDVVGLQRAAAERELEERGFEVERRRIGVARPPGTVVAQRPEPGTLYGKGGIVVVSVARNPLNTDVPDVIGLPTGRALARLRAVELEPRTQVVRASAPAGRVVRQIPEPGGEVPTGSTVVVFVSSGAGAVPDVVGSSVEDATATLSQAGFRVRVERVTSDAAEGTVLAQAPRGGARARRGAIVRLNVSTGPRGGTTTVVTTTTGAQAAVPDVMGEDEATAQATLEGAGFTVQVVDRPTGDANQDGIVVRQSPRGGSRAPSGSTVTIFVGRLS